MSRALEPGIDRFCSELREFTRRVEDDVGQLKRTLEQGYTLGPHQYRERLKALQTQTHDVAGALVRLDEQTHERVSLTELAKLCRVVYGATAEEMDVIEAHLRNYGYQPQATEQKAPHVPCQTDASAEGGATTRPTPQGTPRRSLFAAESMFVRTEPRLSVGSFSTISHDGLRCSPTTLALKQKYAASPTSAAAASFEFRPPEREEMDVEEEKAPPLVEAQTPRPSELSAAQFGSPFRSAHAKPERSVFSSPRKRSNWISPEQYAALPAYLREAISAERLNAAVEHFFAVRPFRTAESLSQHELEAIGDKFCLQAFVKLGFLERHFSDGRVGYRPAGFLS